MERLIARGTALGLGFLGAPLLVAGGYLLWLGGSIYYLIAGITLSLAALFAWKRQPATPWVYAFFTLVTIIWALCEVGLDCWALMPRIMLFSGVGLWFALPAVWRSFNAHQTSAWSGAVLLVMALLVCFIAYQKNSFEAVAKPAPHTPAKTMERGKDWPLYGNTAKGDRFSPAVQITPENVSSLKPAWIFRTGVKLRADAPKGAKLSLQVTPIQIGESLYLCTPYNIAIRLDADTGEEQWRFDPEVKGAYAGGPCRGLTYYGGQGSGAFCDARLYMTAIDNRLLALDPETGKLCSGFGTQGVVDLTAGMGGDPLGFQYATSPPVLVGDVLVVGGSHMDNQSTDQPPGVVRAFDALSGKLLWAWEVLGATARPDPSPETPYTRNTPNAWSLFSADEKLGLVYVPTGNTPPDFYGGKRSQAQERYASSVVSLEAATGNVRWSFQTVHHDLWDLDIASQPVLVDIDTNEGEKPAVIVPTKRGDIFVLDRRTGEPIVPVEERAVPQDVVKGEKLSATQPWPIDFPSFAPADLTEADMWGATPYDQLLCRIKFRELSYEGVFTPPSLQGSLTYPSFWGVLNWGGVAVDPERQIMLVNASYLPFITTLASREAADARGVYAFGSKATKTDSAGEHGSTKGNKNQMWFAQAGTPYAAIVEPFLSPLDFPCHQPPWGKIGAVDLKTNKLLWQRPFGTTEGIDPLGLSLPMGVFNHGGAVTTRSGLMFIGSAMDDYFRAYDVEKGDVLWKAKLPAGGQASPISYISPKTGKQYVVIAAGGHGFLQTTLGDYVVAYALPQ